MSSAEETDAALSAAELSDTRQRAYLDLIATITRGERSILVGEVKRIAAFGAAVRDEEVALVRAEERARVKRAEAALDSMRIVACNRLQVIETGIGCTCGAGVGHKTLAAAEEAGDGE